jgi:asparagine synthase (glutamine-hydrolysing)
MCGIVAVVGRRPEAGADPVARALACLAPRGPDDSGRTAGRLGQLPVTLAARRLALVDPSGGRQPFLRPSGAMLVVNGEIYNHAALRFELARAGETFRTRCDGEVLAALLDREGVEGLARVEGSYAFAFLKAPLGPLLLGRDPSGARPLAFARIDGGLVAASTVEAILATGLVPRLPDVRAIEQVLRDGVVHGSISAIAGVVRVAPGEVLQFGPDLDPRRREVVRVLPGADDPAAAAPSVFDALRLAVLDRLALDRPVAVFLSGGVDSALVAALARERGRVPTFTTTFPGHGDADEGRRASRTASRLGLPNTQVPCPPDPSTWVLGAAAAFDEPFGDASAVPTWGLAKTASTSVRAVLTGTGGDEVFGGYRRYWLLGAGPWLRAVPGFLRSPFAAALSRAAPAGARALRAAGDPEGFYRGLLRLQSVEEADDVAGPLLEDVPGLEGEELAEPQASSIAMEDDRTRYLPDDLLVKEDRALMAHGVEGRHPFLDRRVAAAARQVELRGGVGRARQKQVLRAYVREVVDPDLARVRKHGFSFPCDAFYAGALRPLSEDLLCSRRTRERGFTDPAAVVRLLRDHATGKRTAGAVIHALVMLELWARRVLDVDPGRRS